MRIGISWPGLLLLILVGWTLIGVLSVIRSSVRREYVLVRRHLASIGAVWLVYIAVLLTISLTASPRLIPPGQEQRIGELGFTVIRAETLPGYLVSHGEHVLRVSVRITNHNQEARQRDQRLTAYLVDSQNRRWYETPGLQGVRLSTPVSPGSSVVSEPVFKVAGDATDLRLIFTHGHRLPNLLLFADRDSLLHPPVSVPLAP